MKRFNVASPRRFRRHHNTRFQEPRNVPLCELSFELRFPKITIHVWAGDYICETMLAPDITLHSSHFPAHTVIHPHLPSLPAGCPPVWSPAVRRASSAGSLLDRPPRRGFSASRLLNSPEHTVRLTGVPACQTSHIRGHHLQLGSSSQLTSNCASASHPMRQTAEKEGETNQLRSSCTLHRRQEWCQWHDFGVRKNVFRQSDDHSGQMIRIGVCRWGSRRN